MLAVIKTGGKQYIVEPGKKLKIEKISAEEGKNVTFSDVLLLKDKDIKIGDPLVKGARVVAKVLKHDKAKKVIIFKYKPKKRYRVKRGHRQPYSQIEILEIVG